MRFTPLISKGRHFLHKGFVKGFSTSSAMLSTHIERTADKIREKVTTPATVIAIRQETPTIKGLTLRVEEPEFMFKPGQWVDFKIPEVNTVGGYSMCSTPSQLLSDRTLDLSVKYSKHPPALWVHTKCHVGSTVTLTSGGDFYYDPKSEDDEKDLLLIAGGVGINPLYAILQHMCQTHRSAHKAVILYSAGKTEELAFKNEIQRITETNDKVSATYFITQENPLRIGNTNTLYQRVDRASIAQALERLDKGNLVCFLCGPSPMIHNIENYLREEGIEIDQIKYERWW